MTQANRVKEIPDSVIGRQVKVMSDCVGISYKEFKTLYEQFNAAIRRVGQSNGVTVIDLDTAVPKEKEFMFDIVHYNARGARYAAEVISKNLSFK